MINYPWPADWKLTELENVALISTGCSYRILDFPNDDLNEVIVIDKIDEHYMELSDCKYMKITEREIVKYKLRKDDIVFCHRNSPKHLGKMIRFNSVEKVIHTSKFLRIRTLDFYDSQFMELVLSMYRDSGILSHMASQYTNLQSLALARLKKLKVPMITLDKQKQAIRLYGLKSEPELYGPGR